MMIEEAKDNKDMLIIMMIQERDKQISMLEEENASLKEVLIETLAENRHLEKVVKQLKNKLEQI